MEYTIKRLAQLAHLSTRTLRFYDEINLLKPSRINSSGYRIYGKKEVDRLQLILFFKELGLELQKIKEIIDAPEFNRQEMLSIHLEKLREKRQHLDKLIENVTKTLKEIKGEIKMSDKEKFIGFKQKLIDDNEKKFGKEVRNIYGDDQVTKSNQKILNMTEEEFQESQQLSEEINDLLKKGFEINDPSSNYAQEACEKHAKWLQLFLPKNTYNKTMHKNIGQMYVEDERFKAYYDSIALGCAEFFFEAIKIYCSNK